MLITGLRYAVGLPRYLRPTLRIDDARHLVEAQLKRRDVSFLMVLERGVYANPGSPYRKLRLHANIELSNVSQWVREVGLEGALTRLYEAGVYATSRSSRVASRSGERPG